jgi:hypothetical protein
MVLLVCAIKADAPIVWAVAPCGGTLCKMGTVPQAVNDNTNATMAILEIEIGMRK